MQIYLRSVLDWIISRIVRHVFLWFWCHDNVVSYGTGSPVTLDNLEVVSKGLFSFLHLVRMMKDNVKSRQLQDNIKSWEALVTYCSSLDLIFSSVKYNTSSIMWEYQGSFLFFFFYEEILHAKKSIKCKQATFTQIFYAHKKHKKHKKQLLLIKSTKCNKFCRCF